MSEFTKTLIVDGSLPNPQPPDYNNIQAAVADLDIQTNGGTIIVEEWANTYEITTTISVPDNVTIIGRGNVVLNVTGNVPVFTNSNFSSGTNTNIVLSGFHIKISTSYTSNVIDFIRISNSLLEALTIKSENGVSVSSGKAAICLSGDATHLSSGNRISGCTIESFGQSGNYGNGVYLNTYCDKCMILNNSISNCAKGIYIKETLYRNTYCVIAGNSIKNASSQGINIEKSYYNSIGENTIESCLNGIYLDQVRGCALHGNICNGCTETGIKTIGSSTISCDCNTITGNALVSNTQYGIHVADYSKHNVIYGNSCYDNGSEEILEGSNVSGVEKNLFEANICCDDNAAQKFTLGTNTDSIAAYTEEYTTT